MIYFVTACNYKNITKASEFLHISQSSLSRKIMSLENELGLKLLDRKEGHFELTQAGKTFYDEAQRVIKQQDSLMKRMNKCKMNDAIRIGFSHNLFLRPCMDAVEKLKEANPDKEIRFFENRLYKIVNDLVNDNLDIIYITRGDVEGLPNIAFYPMLENEPSVLVSKSHRLWKKQSVSYEDLRGERICIEADTHRNRSFSRTFDDHVINGMSIHDFREVIFCSNVDEMLMYVCSCNCVCLWAMVTDSGPIQYPERIKNIRLDCPGMNHGDIGLAYKEDNTRIKQLMEQMVK